MIARVLLAATCGLPLAAPLDAVAAAPSIEVDRCLTAAASKHGVAYALLRAIAEQESHFNPTAIRRPNTAGNTDGSTDYGLMQINSSWLPLLARYGVTPSSLLTPCISADVGAWILAGNIQRLGLTWDAVGAYNAQTPWKRVRYATGVHAKLQRFLKQPGSSLGMSRDAYTTATSTAEPELGSPSVGASRGIAVWESTSVAATVADGAAVTGAANE